MDGVELSAEELSELRMRLIREAIWTFARDCNYADGMNDSHARGVLSGAIVVAIYADALYPGEEWRC